ncbi:hypothetical protein GGQ80_001219 [Sphingomonas jinjuensis]|jgi:hypothetical protein|uniref:Uncharacterized protein n=1 Tax=Sphingomonas jinjuensis TaxID=535907 RepID=A0A840FCN1_9SPHN|nr:hypothetical protein [Sphingomonas jinjuensis]
MKKVLVMLVAAAMMSGVAAYVAAARVPVVKAVK